MTKLVIVCAILPIWIKAQTPDWGPFKNLVNKTWTAEGSWGDGSYFKQAIHFSYDLNEQIIVADAQGYTNQEQTAYGNRNHGIRKYDSASDKFVFYEFDVFGGLTSGEIIFDDQDIIYQYQYGESIVTDMWQYVNDSTYTFIVGSYNEGKWHQKYLETEFKLRHKTSSMLRDISASLVGHWSSPAWDGILKEEWKLSDDQLIQNVEYIENGKVTYASQSYMAEKAGELILTSIVKNSNPKIFKATSISENQIIFENSDYKNPNKVTYYLLGNRYNRKIEGIENNAHTEYLFQFNPLKE